VYLNPVWHRTGKVPAGPQASMEKNCIPCSGLASRCVAARYSAFPVCGKKTSTGTSAAPNAIAVKFAMPVLAGGTTETTARALPPELPNRLSLLHTLFQPLGEQAQADATDQHAGHGANLVAGVAAQSPGDSD
jgi:hypothetical protein